MLLGLRFWGPSQFTELIPVRGPPASPCETGVTPCFSPETEALSDSHPGSRAPTQNLLASPASSCSELLIWGSDGFRIFGEAHRLTTGHNESGSRKQWALLSSVNAVISLRRSDEKGLA